jgi:hypothetical protein
MRVGRQSVLFFEGSDNAQADQVLKTQALEC